MDLLILLPFLFRALLCDAIVDNHNVHSRRRVWSSFPVLMWSVQRSYVMYEQHVVLRCVAPVMKYADWATNSAPSQNARSFGEKKIFCRFTSTVTCNKIP